MLQPLLDEADAVGKQIMMTSSAAGRTMYLKAGFRVVEEASHDFTHLGASGPRLMLACVRDPQDPK